MINSIKILILLKQLKQRNINIEKEVYLKSKI